ncbi:hypothetical protein [Bradyrhizobium sp. Ce-3]|uniref:portal protein n=1 Tax=Bradyrhizobium sp. Ce-3 TaxID=2913970 RepID=UPI001FC88E71|nr:hypothetical protein [Bradyrhizobium sp. Ce-3]GKQ52860.1 hypothetical protein BRSPCE3_37150 [Bradyrhizobium sp. Ce-3]
MRLRNAWITVDPRNWKTRDDMTINVGLGTGGKAQQFAQVVALANVQKELIGGGKLNMVGDRELYNTAVELTRIMGHKNPGRFSPAAQAGGQANSEAVLAKDDKHELMAKHAFDSRNPLSPYISITTDPEVARSYGDIRSTGCNWRRAEQFETHSVHIVKASTWFRTHLTG